jgi:hypothetical protein
MNLQKKQDYCLGDRVWIIFESMPETAGKIIWLGEDSVKVEFRQMNYAGDNDYSCVTAHLQYDQIKRRQCNE